MLLLPRLGKSWQEPRVSGGVWMIFPGALRAHVELETRPPDSAALKAVHLSHAGIRPGLSLHTEALIVFVCKIS